MTHPDLLTFVDEAIARNDAIELARLFNESAPIGGPILAKTDADANSGSTFPQASINVFQGILNGNT